MNIFIVRCAQCAVLGYIRPKSALAVCCGLLAKWLWVGAKVRVRVRLGLELGLGLGQGPGNALAVLFFLCSYKCSEHLGPVVSVSMR